MKIIFVVFIMLLSFIIGYLYRNKIQNELNFLLYLKKFSDYLKSGINLFKNNIVEIIDEFIILENQKNAKFNKIFLKNMQIYNFCLENIENFIYDKQISFTIYNFLKTLGTNEYEYEGEKINSFILFIGSKILEYEKKLKEKGELFFKVALSIGAVISILVW